MDRAVVIDNGSFMCKAGFAGDDAPVALVATVVPAVAETDLIYYVGEEGRSKSETQYPIQKGVITNWDDMEKMWRSIFSVELHTAPSEHAVLLTEPPLNAKANREKTTEMMFETFGVPAMHLSVDASLSLYSTGRVSGIVVDSGYDFTRIVPISKGYTLPHAILHLDIGGRQLTDYLYILMCQRGYTFTIKEDWLLDDIKKRVCCIPLNFEEEIRKSSASNETVKYELPDRSSIEVGVERFRCPEPLFQPLLLGLEASGIHQLTRDCVMKCDVDFKANLYKSVVLGGGTASIKGFAARMEKELNALLFSTMPASVTVARDNYSTWCGGSIFASLASATPDLFMQKSEYDEFGSALVHRKCF
jgi:actin-related protein